MQNQTQLEDESARTWSFSGAFPSLLERYLDGLRKAGLKE